MFARIYRRCGRLDSRTRIRQFSLAFDSRRQLRLNSSTTRTAAPFKATTNFSDEIATETKVQTNTRPKETLMYNLNNYISTFPEDNMINSQINTLKQLLYKKHHSQTIKVGLLYANDSVRESSKILECLLGDPLASNNKVWFDAIQNRVKGQSKFIYNGDSFHVSENGNEFHVPAPILSSIYRSTLYSATEKNEGQEHNVVNDILLEEVDKTSISDRLDEFAFFIYVTTHFGGVGNNSNLPLLVQNKILLEIIDNIEYTPHSTQSSPLRLDNSLHTHVVKINSQLAYEGIIAFLKDDVEAADILINNMSHSNIYELYKVIGKFLQTNTLCNWYLDNITSSVRNELTGDVALAEDEAGFMQAEISNFVQTVNAELQYRFAPDTNQFVRSRLSWWKLYYKNDNVEYDLKDFFNEHFMNQSIESYNFLRGRILSADDSIAAEKNPLLELKNDVINRRVTEEVQPMVYSIISKAFVYYQLPITVLSAFAYQFFDFSGNASIALLGLGWVVGFNYVSRNWLAFIKAWILNLVEDIRVCISTQCVNNGLMRESNIQTEKEKAANIARRKILQELEKA